MKGANSQPRRKPQAARSPGRPPGRTLRDGVLADRETLLTAAERLIRKEGTGVSLEAIAIEAGVTKPILYRGVGDRQALVFALAERLAQRMAGDVERKVAAASSTEDALRRLVAGYLDGARVERNLYLYVTAGVTGDGQLEQSLLLADRTAEQFAEGIASFRAAHGADPGVATVWSIGLVGALHYVTLWWLREETADLTVVTEQLTALLWAGMKLDETGSPGTA